MRKATRIERLVACPRISSNPSQSNNLYWFSALLEQKVFIEGLQHCHDILSMLEVPLREYVKI